MKIRPLHDNVLVRREARPTMSAGGLHIPEIAQERAKTAEVLAVGPGVRHSDGRFEPTTVRPGDVVLFNYMTRAQALDGGNPESDQTLFLVKEHELLGVVAR